MRFTLQTIVACLAADASSAVRGQLRQGSDQRDDRKLQIDGGGRPHPTPSSFRPLGDEEQSEIVSLSKACAVGEESKCCHELGAESGGIVKNVFAWTRQCEIDLPSSKIQAMSRNAKVSAVEHNAPVWALQAPLSWGLDRIDQVDLPLDNSATKLDAAGTRVFIIDTGVHSTHNDFTGLMGPASCHVNTSGDGGAPQTDRNGHGTHVASTACGHTYGVTANCEICSVQALQADGGGSHATVIAGVNFAIDQCSTGLCVANLSLGGGRSTALNAAVAAAYRNGVVMAVAAGNSNSNACWSSPASETTAITVGSTTRSDTASSFSSFGPCVDVYAPGSDITAAWHTGNTARNTISGTSMASPHVAGIAANLVGQGKATNPEEVTNWILDNVVANGIDTRGPGRDQGLVLVFERPPTRRPTPPPTPPPRPRPRPRPSPPSCMSGETRVGITGKANSKPVRDLDVGDVIEGLDEKMEPAICSVEAVGHFGTGVVFGNYTQDHFVLDPSDRFVRPNGNHSEMEQADLHTVLTSCPVGVDESGIGFTAFAETLFGDKALGWSDYVLIHKSIVNIVREVGPFVFYPSTYTSMRRVKKYTHKLYKTMLTCAKKPDKCDAFEEAAVNLVENALTKKAKKMVKSGFGKLGDAKMAGSVAAAVSNGKSIKD